MPADHGMTGIGLVLDQHLPIATVQVAQRRALDHQLSLRRAVDHVVDRRQALPEELLEALPALVQLDEDEVAVDVEVGDRAQTAGGFSVVQSGILVTLLERDRQQLAVGPERPGVIGAAKELAGVAALLRGDARALVRTAVVENVNRSVAMAHHQKRLVTDRRRDIVAGLGKLAGVTHVDPGLCEEMAHLQVEDLGVYIDVPVHLGVSYQRTKGGGVFAITVHS